MSIAEKCMGVTFSIAGEDGAECIDVVDSLKYLVGYYTKWTRTGRRYSGTFRG